MCLIWAWTMKPHVYFVSWYQSLINHNYYRAGHFYGGTVGNHNIWERKHKSISNGMVERKQRKISLIIPNLLLGILPFHQHLFIVNLSLVLLDIQSMRKEHVSFLPMSICWCPCWEPWLVCSWYCWVEQWTCFCVLYISLKLFWNILFYFTWTIIVQIFNIHSWKIKHPSLSRYIHYHDIFPAKYHDSNSTTIAQA